MKCPMCKTPMAGGRCPKCKYQSNARGLGMIGCALSDRDLRVAAAPFGAAPGAIPNMDSGQTQGVSNEALDRFHNCQVQIQETLDFLQQLQAQSGGNAPAALSFMTQAVMAAARALNQTIDQAGGQQVG